jgi:hypothetical protein
MAKYKNLRISVMIWKSKVKTCQVPVAHTYNPSYSGDRDQEDCGLKPAQANSLQDSISKNPPNTKGPRTAKTNKQNRVTTGPSNPSPGHTLRDICPSIFIAALVSTDG